MWIVLTETFCNWIICVFYVVNDYCNVPAVTSNFYPCFWSCFSKLSKRPLSVSTGDFMWCWRLRYHEMVLFYPLLHTLFTNVHRLLVSCISTLFRNRSESFSIIQHRNWLFQTDWENHTIPRITNILTLPKRPPDKHPDNVSHLSNQRITSWIKHHDMSRMNQLLIRVY